MYSSPKRFMGVLFLAMMNVSVMVSLRNLPVVAEFGFAAATLFFLVALLFFLPVALISAELATGWPKEGGIYIWVKEAFGPFWGFFAVWMQWVHNVTWFPAILSFSAATFALLFFPTLATHPSYLFFSVLGGFWALTLFNYFKIETSTWFSVLGVLFGTILPGLFLIVLACLWMIRGDSIQIAFSSKAFLPNLADWQNLVFLAGLFLAFGGIEVSAVYAKDVENPRKNYPIAILIAGLLSFLLYTLGALSIAIMIPPGKISLIKGLMDAFDSFLLHFNIHWLFIPVGLLIVIAAISELNAWIIGPVEALHATTKHGDLPPIFQKINKNGRPFSLLLFQAIIASIAAIAFFLMPSASTAFWILSAMSAQIYLVMYILLILSGIKLRYSHPHVERKYKVPFKNKGMWVLGLIGLVASLFGFLVGFIPPKAIPSGNLFSYEAFMLIGLLIVSIIPYIIFKYRHEGWHPENQDENREKK